MKKFTIEDLNLTEKDKETLEKWQKQLDENNELEVVLDGVFYEEIWHLNKEQKRNNNLVRLLESLNPDYKLFFKEKERDRMSGYTITNYILARPSRNKEIEYFMELIERGIVLTNLNKLKEVGFTVEGINTQENIFLKLTPSGMMKDECIKLSSFYTNKVYVISINKWTMVNKEYMEFL